MLKTLALIIIGIIAYIICGMLTAKFVSKYDTVDKEVFVVICMIWPIVLPIQLLIVIFTWAYDKVI